MGSEFGTVLPVPCPFHVDKRGGGGGWLFPLILVSTPNLLAPASLLFFDCKYYAVLCNLFPFPPLPLLLGNPTSQTLFSCHPYAFHPPPPPCPLHFLGGSHFVVLLLLPNIIKYCSLLLTASFKSHFITVSTPVSPSLHPLYSQIPTFPPSPPPPLKGRGICTTMNKIIPF